jgi:hypothetical protein
MSFSQPASTGGTRRGKRRRYAVGVVDSRRVGLVDFTVCDFTVRDQQGATVARMQRMQRMQRMMVPKSRPRAGKTARRCARRQEDQTPAAQARLP